MKTSTVNFERRNKSVSKVRSTIEYITKTANTREEATNRLREILPSELKVGFGGHHVWCANAKDERIFIIYF